MDDISTAYQSLYARDSKNFNTCFFCGCLSTDYDYSPPLKYASFYLTTNEYADFYKIPCCTECASLLASINTGDIKQRQDIVNSKLRVKYQSALKIYESWDKEELDELDYKFRSIINAGLQLGEETYNRIRFNGFNFEVDGNMFDRSLQKIERYSVFKTEFEHFRDALQYGAKTFSVPINKLKELFIDNGKNFDKAIRLYHEEQTEILFEKELKKSSALFAKKYKQNKSYIKKTVLLYMSENDDLSIEMALDKLYNERIKDNKVGCLEIG